MGYGTKIGYIRQASVRNERVSFTVRVAFLKKDVRVGRIENETRKLEAMKKDEVEELLKKYGIKLEKDAGYDCVYVANMAKADYYKSSIADESHLALFVKDYIDDPDGYEGLPFTRFYADCIGSGTPIMWSDML